MKKYLLAAALVMGMASAAQASETIADNATGMSGPTEREACANAKKAAKESYDHGPVVWYGQCSCNENKYGSADGKYTCSVDFRAEKKR